MARRTPKAPRPVFTETAAEDAPDLAQPIPDEDVEKEATQVALSKLNKDLLAVARQMTPASAKNLVGSYYRQQHLRILNSGYARMSDQSRDPSALSTWLTEQSIFLEGQLRGALLVWANATPLGRWSMSIVGIGPVLAAGLLAHLDIERSATAGSIWRFAGLDPTVVWKKGEPRPWNATLKVLCWKIGESFIKTKTRQGSQYGPLYDARKQYEIDRNEVGYNATYARHMLETFNFRKDSIARQAYLEGKIPPMQIRRRSARYVTKLFLAHWHEVAYFLHYGKLPPLPYPIVYLGHVHVYPVPNADLVPGLAEANDRRLRIDGRYAPKSLPTRAEVPVTPTRPAPALDDEEPEVGDEDGAVDARG